MAFSSRLALVVALFAAWFAMPGVAGTVDAAETSHEQVCEFTPPGGPFVASLVQAPTPPSAGALPDNPGAWSTLITPNPRHRWDPGQGLVKSGDGSLLLHGVVDGPAAGERRLNVIVLVDYGPVDVDVDAWDASRTTHLGKAYGPRAHLQAGARAFDISVPGSDGLGDSYREVQTLVWLDGGRIDARRWTVYTGVDAPPPVKCVDVREAVADKPGRTTLDENGVLAIRAPRATTLAIVPFRGNEPDVARFLRFETAGQGLALDVGAEVDLVAAWEAPLSGPGPGWISSFWSARAVAPAGTPR